MRLETVPDLIRPLALTLALAVSGWMGLCLYIVR